MKQLVVLTARHAIPTIYQGRERTWYEHRMLRHDRPRINLHVFGRTAPSMPVTSFSGIGFGPTRRIAPDMRV
jgi:hypothetical protein